MWWMTWQAPMGVLAGWVPRNRDAAESYAGSNGCVTRRPMRDHIRGLWCVSVGRGACDTEDGERRGKERSIDVTVGVPTHPTASYAAGR